MSYKNNGLALKTNQFCTKLLLIISSVVALTGCNSQSNDEWKLVAQTKKSATYVSMIKRKDSEKVGATLLYSFKTPRTDSTLPEQDFQFSSMIAPVIRLHQ